MSYKERTITAIQKTIQEHAAWSEVAAGRLAEIIYEAEPPRCDWDCDHCRDDEDEEPRSGVYHDPHGFLILPPNGEEP